MNRTKIDSCDCVIDSLAMVTLDRYYLFIVITKSMNGKGDRFDQREETRWKERDSMEGKRLDGREELWRRKNRILRGSKVTISKS